MNIKTELFKLQDKKYKEFSAKLNPTVDPKTVIGVRTPDNRALAKKVFSEGNYQKFFNSLPHKYIEENSLHAFIICLIKDYDECIKETNKFLPYVDNWAVCDTMSPKVFSKHKEELIKEIKKWIKSKHAYTIRFGIEMLQTHFLDEEFKPEYLDLVCKVKSKEYYVNMMRAWFFATAMAKQEKATLPYLDNKKLDEWTHLKTISKCVDSYRISDSMKKHLKTLR